MTEKQLFILNEVKNPESSVKKNFLDSSLRFRMTLLIVVHSERSEESRELVLKKNFWILRCASETEKQLVILNEVKNPESSVKKNFLDSSLRFRKTEKQLVILNEVKNPESSVKKIFWIIAAHQKDRKNYFLFYREVIINN